MEKRSIFILNLFVKTILYLLISLLFIMCYIERQKSRESAPTKSTARNQVTHTGTGLDKTKPKQ